MFGTESNCRFDAVRRAGIVESLNPSAFRTRTSLPFRCRHGVALGYDSRCSCLPEELFIPEKKKAKMERNTLCSLLVQLADFVLLW